MRQGVGSGGGWGLETEPGPSHLISRLTFRFFLPHSPVKAHAGDAAEDEAANAGPVTQPQLHIAMDILPVFQLALLTPEPQWPGLDPFPLDL